MAALAAKGEVIMRGAMYPTLEHALLVDAVRCVLKRIAATHGVAQPPLDQSERRVLAELKNIQSGQQAKDYVVHAAFADLKHLSWPIELQSELWSE